MFEAIFLSTLSDDTELTSYVSTYTDSEGDHPAIFVNRAPENTNFPYMDFKISDDGNVEDNVIDVFTITINFFDYSSSGVTARKAVMRLVDLLDEKRLSDSNYDNIRLYKDSINYIEHDDIRAQHYNMRFQARAGRSGWMQRTT